MRLLVAAAALLAAPALAVPGLTAADSAAAYAAAGYTMVNGKLAGCEGEQPGRPASRYAVDIVDLNVDGRPEAIITETNAACYGVNGSSFTVVSKDVGGRWRRIGGSVGTATRLPARHLGWADLRVSVAGATKPVALRWNGLGYQ